MATIEAPNNAAKTYPTFFEDRAKSIREGGDNVGG